MPETALLVAEDGTVSEIHLPAGHTLLALRRAIGCARVDVVRLTTTLDMWIDDDGLYTKPVNPAATLLARRYGKTWQDYHGPAVIAGLNAEGDTIGLTDEQTVGVLTALADIAG